MSLLSEVQRHPDATLRFCAEMTGSGALHALEAMYASGRFSRVIITGTASGLNACEAAITLLREGGICTILADSANLRSREASIVTEDSLIIAVSCSPAEWDTTKLCLDLQEHPGLVTVFSSRSLIGSYGRVRIALMDGETGQLPLTAYTNACTAMWAVTETLLHGADAALAWLGERLSWYAYIQEGFVLSGMRKTLKLAELLQDVKQVTVVSSGLSAGSARQAAWLLGETAPFDTKVVSLDDFLQNPECECALFFDLTERDRVLLEKAEAQVRSLGGRTAIITNRDMADLSDRVSLRMGTKNTPAGPMCEIIPVEMLAAFYTDGREVFENAAAVCPGGA